MLEEPENNMAFWPSIQIANTPEVTIINNAPFEVPSGHKAAYGICAETYSDLQQLKNGGIIDIGQVVHAGAWPNAKFVADCNKLGLTPIFQNGNDGKAGMGNNDPNTYYKMIANAGYHAAGGESESLAEMNAIMANLIFLNDGGQGLNPNDDIFLGNTKLPAATGHGIASYLETYDDSSHLWYDDVINAAVSAKKHGCKEVGLMIGAWMPVNAAPYIALAQTIEAKGVPIAGFYIWWGFSINMNAVYTKWAGVIAQLQKIWPPETRTMKERFGAPIPTPSPVPIPVPAIGSPIARLKLRLVHGRPWFTLNGYAKDAQGNAPYGRGTGLWEFDKTTKTWIGRAWCNVLADGSFSYVLTSILPKGVHQLRVQTNDGPIVTLDEIEIY